MQIGANIAIDTAAHTGLAGGGSSPIRGRIGPVVGLTADLVHYLEGSIGPVAGVTGDVTYIDYADETVTLLAAMSVAPDADRANLINDTIVALKGAGLWSKLDRLWMIAAHNVQAARLNWKNPAQSLTLTNSPSFGADLGYQSDGSTSYIRTGFTPSTAGGVMTANSASLFARPTTNVVDFTASVAFTGGVGVSNAGSTTVLVTSAETLTAIVCGGGSAIAGATVQSDKRRMYAGSRRSQSDAEAYLNGASEAVDVTNNARSLPALEMYVLCRNSNGSPAAFAPSGLYIGAVGYGSGLSDAEEAALTTIINDYITNL